MGKIVIVLGNTITALGTLRACAPLKQEGYQIFLVSVSRLNNIAIKSNIPDKKIVLKRDLISGLLDLAKDFSAKPILLFTRDDEVVEVSEHHEHLKKHYCFLLPDQAIVETLMEKGKFAAFAEANNLPTPKTEYIKDETALLTIERRIPFPIIVKPYLLHAFKVGHQKQLQALVAKFKQVNYQSMVAQEYIEGTDDQLYFCFLLFNEDGELVRWMYARKLRQWPVSYGTTSLAMTIQDQRLAAAVEQFKATIKIRGFCSIEFKYDAIHDRYLIMEPTVGRFNQQIALTVASGVNFPIGIVRLLTGKKLERSTQKNGIIWIYESNDLLSFLRSKTKYGYFNNFLKPHVSVLYAAEDPNPLLHEIGDMARKKIKKILRYV